MAEEQEDFSQLPLPDRFTHKAWKVRKEGYEAAAKEFRTCQPTDPIIKDFTFDSNLWKGAVGDSNVAAQQEALGAYNAFLDAAGIEGARRTRSTTITPIVEKGLTGRPAAKQSALESLMLLVELDKPDPVIEELIPLLSHKQPKIIAATLSALTSVYHAYGCKTVEPKPVLKLLPKVYGHADKNVRAEAQNLTVEFYRWLKDAMKPLFWGELKPVQQTDLEKLFAPLAAEPAPKQERLLRSQQAAKEEAAAAPEPAEADGAEEEEAEIDLEPEYMAVDVIPKIPKDFSDRLASAKWKDRKEALDETYTAVNVPAIREGQFDEYVRGMAKSMKDANIAVVTVAANCVECLAKGLRKSFARYRSMILTPMLERFKEKKQSVTDALAAACDAVFASTGLGEIQEEVLEAMKNKNPQVKEHSARFLVRCLKTTRDAPSPEQTKTMSEAGKALLSESSAPLRDAGAEVLGVLWKIMSDRNMLTYLEGIDEIKKTKIKEFCDAAEVKAKWKPKAAPAPKANVPAATKKPALGTKRPAGGVKKTAPAPTRPVSPPEEAPLAPRPTSRPAPKPAGGGLKAPSGLQKPGLKKPSPAPATSSPKRQGMVVEDSPAIPKPSGLGRGLAGRPLGKPASTPASPPPAPRESSASSALSTIERQELADLRQEVEYMRNQASDLRNDKMKLTSQIHELQNQNAQLIEDHTRDMLSIKAKETQLVRARGDFDSSEERANALSREVDRLKREVSRLGRSQDDANGLHDSGYGRPAYGSSRSFNVPPPGRTNGTNGSNAMYAMADETKENVYGEGEHKLAPARLESNGETGAMDPPPLPASRDAPPSAGMMRSQSDGVESWRRAAEVTQNLKARIEMMKARQNIGRGQ